MRGLAASIILFGCYNAGHAVTGGDGGGSGAGDGAHPPDAPGIRPVNVDAEMGSTCYGTDDGSTGIVRVCIPTPLAGITAPPSVVDTGLGTGCDITTTTTSQVVCVVSGDHVVITNLHASGPRPLVIVGTTIELDGTGAVDVSGDATSPGPGGGSGCSGGSGGDDGGSGASGGAGGGFAGTGGSGAGSSGGIPLPITLGTDAFRAGCDGGSGGDSQGSGGGAGGFAGGAVALLATDSITIESFNGVRARGGGGGAGTKFNAGGGGGASGGMIVLEAMTITLETNSDLEAGGGGGGQGADNGMPGGDGIGENAKDGTAASCFASGTAGGLCGVSSAGTNMNGGPGATGPAGTGAGGGGGGAGKIRLFPKTQGEGSNSISPPVP